MAQHLQVRDLQAGIGNKPILAGLNLDIRAGEVHALMGPNGSGKSTLANVLMGHPSYSVTGGSVTLDGEDYLGLSTSERALKGVFLAFQYPVEIAGVTVGKFLKRAMDLRANGTPLNVTAYIKQLREAMTFMEMDQDFINRSLNQGFSGGEKKRMEVLQMLMLKPSLAILDETDSGLDIDALKIVSRGVNKMREMSSGATGQMSPGATGQMSPGATGQMSPGATGQMSPGATGEPGFGALIITHYQRILTQIVPDFVHIMYKGRIVTSGGKELVETLESRGYDWVKEQYGIEEEANEGSVARR